MEKMGRFEIRLCFFLAFSLSFLSLIVSVSAASLPSPSLTVPASLQVGTKAIIPFTFSSNIFADVLSPQHPGLQFLLCKASETTPALCVQGARSDARNSLSRPAPFFEGSAARDKGSAGSFELDLMRVVPGTYNLYVFAVWWPTSSKGIVAGRYDTYKSPSFEVGANPNASPFDFDGDGCIGDKDLYILDNDKCPTSEGGVKLTECKVAVNGEKNFQIVALACGQAWGSSLQCSAH